MCRICTSVCIKPHIMNNIRSSKTILHRATVYFLHSVCMYIHTYVHTYIDKTFHHSTYVSMCMDTQYTYIETYVQHIHIDSHSHTFTITLIQYNIAIVLYNICNTCRRVYCHTTFIQYTEPRYTLHYHSQSVSFNVLCSALNCGGVFSGKMGQNLQQH